MSHKIIIASQARNQLGENLPEAGREIVPYSGNKIIPSPRGDEIVDGSLVEETGLTGWSGFLGMLDGLGESARLSKVNPSPIRDEAQPLVAVRFEPPAPPVSVPVKSSRVGGCAIWWLILFAVLFIATAYILNMWSFGVCVPLGGGMQFCF